MIWRWNKCKRLINYNNYTISISGLGPDPTTCNVRDIKIQQDLIEAAVAIAQMYDNLQYSNCLRIHKYRGNSLERDRLILEMHKNEERLLEFLTMLRIAIARPTEEIQKAIADWVAFSFSERIKDKAPIVSDKSELVKQPYELPPKEELAKLERSVTKAKQETTYLKYALRRPRFDIQKVYELKLSDVT